MLNKKGLNIIPMYLFNECNNHYAENWANKTYVYRILYETKNLSEENKRQRLLDKWIDEVKKILEFNKIFGYSKAQKQIVHLISVKHNLTQENRNIILNAITAIDIITDKKRYNNNRQLYLEAIHDIQANMYKRKSNTWVTEASEQIMEKYNIAYMPIISSHTLGCTERLIVITSDDNLGKDIIQFFREKWENIPTQDF